MNTTDSIQTFVKQDLTSNDDDKSFQVGRQLSIYRVGRTLDRRSIPVSVEELETAARGKVTPEVYEWVAGGAGRGEATVENVDAFARWRIAPRMFCDIAERDFSVELCGQRFAWPVLVAPIGLQGLADAEGEAATARASADVGVPFVLSTVSSVSMEAVAQASGAGPRWFQLYRSSDDDLNRSLLARAEKAGYSAVVVTLDTPTLGWREGNLSQGYLPFLHGLGIANYLTDPVFRASLSRTPEDDLGAAVEHYLKVFSDLKGTWKDLSRLTEMTRLPILVKGVQRGDDARLAVDYGANGIVVSNHGGRQVEGGIATIDALPEVCQAVDGRVTVLVDGGIRRGCDVFKAIALGADAVLIGRPVIWALALDGADGVRTFLQNFLTDLDLTFALAGKRRVAEVGMDDLRRRTDL